MRIGAKIELGFDDDSFVGFERSSELFAVVVGGLGHDDGDVASWIGLLGTGSERLRDVHMCTPHPGGGVGYGVFLHAGTLCSPFQRPRAHQIAQAKECGSAQKLKWTTMMISL